MSKTFFLNPDTWDLTIDNNGNIATVIDAYAIAQNVANAVRLFTKDAYFNQADGIAHFTVELGQLPSESLVQEKINNEALTIPGVANAITTLTKFENRQLEGNIEITTTSGDTVNVAI